MMPSRRLPDLIITWRRCCDKCNRHWIEPGKRDGSVIWSCWCKPDPSLRNFTPRFSHWDIGGKVEVVLVAENITNYFLRFPPPRVKTKKKNQKFASLQISIHFAFHDKQGLVHS